MTMGCVRANSLAFCEIGRFLRESVRLLRDFTEEFANFLCEIGGYLRGFVRFQRGFVRFLREFNRTDDQYLGESTVDLDKFRYNLTGNLVELRS